VTTPQQPELRRSGRSAADPKGRKALEDTTLPPDGGPIGGVPADNRPGHHPDVEQDKPDLDAVAEALGTRPRRRPRARSSANTKTRRRTAMNDPIAMLKQDHKDVSAMLKTLADSRPGARRRSTVEKLTAALTLHMEFEEQWIYPIVSEEIDEESAEEASIEHELARQGLAELNRLVDEPGFGAAVAMLTAGIKHHVKEEEGEMFPSLKQELDREALSELGDELAATKSAQRRGRRSRAA
jgi:hemerythrin-like domain-containing protein